MFRHTNRLDRLVLASVATWLLGMAPLSETNAWQQPPTPCPCEAEGVCRPNGPWGHTPTKWRPWPGDVISQPTTPSAEADEQKRLELPPFELPPPEMEGLRGPNKSKPPKAKKKDQGTAEPAEAAAPEPEMPVPDANPLEGLGPEAFDLQDNFDRQPPAEKQPAAELPPLGQPAVELPQEEASPLPGLDLEKQPQTEPQPETQPDEDFDPFGYFEPPKSTPVPAGQRTSRAPTKSDDAPPQLPPSLRKFSQRSTPTRRATVRDSRLFRPAVAAMQ